MNDRIFYYWNGSTIQELFTHQSAELLENGELDTSLVPGKDIGFVTLNSLENGMARIDHEICLYENVRLMVLVKVPLGTSTNLLSVQVKRDGIPLVGSNPSALDSPSYRYYYFDYPVIPNGEEYSFNIRWLAPSQPIGFLEYEAYRIYSHGAYFTTTQKGTVFAHITNGNEGDGRVRIRYFKGEGLQPETLTATNLTQANIDDPGYTLPYAAYDWRSPWLTTTSNDIISTSQNWFQGMSELAVQYPSISSSTTAGYYYIEAFSTTRPDVFMKYVFNGEGAASTFSQAKEIKGTLIDAETGRITTSIGDDIELEWHRIDLFSFGTEGVDWYIEDICTPDKWTANSLAEVYYWLPMLAIYPYTKKIFF